MKLVSGLMAAASAACLLASGAHAATVYDNGAPNGLSGNEVTHWYQGEDVRFDATTEVTGATIYLFSLGGTPVTGLPVTYDLWLGGNSGPTSNNTYGAGLNLTYTDTGLSYGFAPIYAVSFDLVSPVFLQGGVTYWFTFHATNSFADSGVYFATTGSNGTTTGFENENGTLYPWTANGQEHAFSLQSGTGAVPEPATWAMMIVGFGLSGAALRRRRMALA